MSAKALWNSVCVQMRAAAEIALKIRENEKMQSFTIDLVESTT